MTTLLQRKKGDNRGIATKAMTLICFRDIGGIKTTKNVISQQQRQVSEINVCKVDTTFSRFMFLTPLISLKFEFFSNTLAYLGMKTKLKSGQKRQKSVSGFSRGGEPKRVIPTIKGRTLKN